MSVDLSAPEIQSAHQQILNKADATSWFILSYGSPPSSLRLVASGAAPPLPQIRDNLAGTTEDVLFGYAEVGGKGLVIAFMRDNVGLSFDKSPSLNSLWHPHCSSVPRPFTPSLASIGADSPAEYDEHEPLYTHEQSPRSFRYAQKVSSAEDKLIRQDYAALITVAHPSQLSDEDVAEKLGLNLQSLHQHTSRPPAISSDPRYPAHLGKHTPSHLAIGGRSSSSSASSAEPSPPVPEKDFPVSASRGFPTGPGSASTSSLASQDSQRSRTSSRRGGANTPKLQQDLRLAGEADSEDNSVSTPPRHRHASSHDHDHLNKMTTPSGKPSPLPLAPPTDTTPTSHPHSRIVSAPIHSYSPIEHKGIASTDVFPESAQRNRKTSLTSRLGHLGHAFGRGSPKSPKSPSTSSPSASGGGGFFGSNGSNGSAAPSPSSPKETKGPNSPTIARFMNSNLARNFGRRASGGPTPPTSPGAADLRRQSVPPPLPPKDGEENAVTYTPPAESSGASSISRRVEEDMRVRDDTRGQLGVQADQDTLARSNSGQRALSEASQKRLRDESEIQEKFRRDEEERARARERVRASSGHEEANHADEEEEDGSVNGILDRYTRDSVYVESRRNIVPDEEAEPVPALDRRYESDEEDDIGLPYDRPDPDSPSHPGRRLPVPPAAAALPALGPPIGHSHHPSEHRSTVNFVQPADPSAQYDAATVSTDHSSRLPSRSASYHTPVPAASTPGAIEDEAREAEPHQGLTRDVGEDESVTERFMEMDMAEEGHAGGKAVELSVLAEEHAREEQAKRAIGGDEQAREAEAHRARVREEYMRREREREAESIRLAEEAKAEEARRVQDIQRAEDERLAAQRRAEEEHQAEMERLERERIEEERRREEARVAEERRVEEERIAEERRLEEGRRAEQRRLEEERIAEARRQEEQRAAEEQRQQLDRAEAERKRKEDIVAGLNRGKEGGGIMLSGWITVQTSKSMIWRRRWFNFYANEIKLFKSELDTKPIQTVPLGHAVRISHTYEESQVQGSFKVMDQNGEEWYMFTDGTEEKETVLAAFAIAVA